MSPKEFKNLSLKLNPNLPANPVEFEQQVFSDDDMSFCNALYANDIPQTCFSKKSHPWNLRNLRSNLELCHTQFNNSPVEDVTRSFVYFGSPKSKFILHIENSNTYSINYLQSGAGKVWFTIHPDDTGKLLDALRDLYPDQMKNCPTFYRHKTIFFSPALF